MDAKQFQDLWHATATVLDHQQKFDTLISMIEVASDLSAADVRDSLAGEEKRNDILLSLVLDVCSLPKASTVLRQIRNEDEAAAAAETREFFSDSLTAQAARSPRLQPVLVSGEHVAIQREYWDWLGQQLQLTTLVPDADENALLGGVYWEPAAGVRCVAALYNSPRGPYLDPFATLASGKVRTICPPPRKSLQEPLRFAGLGTFYLSLSDAVP